MSVSQTVISQQVGVSRSAVSHVLNGRGNMVSADTRKRIHQALEANGYHRNALVRALKENRTHVIGIIVPEVGHSFFAEIIEAAENQASANGLQCFLCQSHSRIEVLEKELTALREYRVDGVLIFPSSSSAFPQVYRDLEKQKYPFVIVDVPIGGLKTAYVGNDNVCAGRLAAEHLLGLGHRRIVFISGYHESLAAHDRLAGFQQALKTARVPVDPSLVVGDGFTFEQGRSAVAQLLKCKAKFSAIVAPSDFAALGVMQELAGSGLRVPEDVSVIGCGNRNFSSMVRPSLTTINQNPQKLGREAINALVKQIEGKSTRALRLTVAPELIARKSTAAWK
ncbi:MAG: LacI family DNA-binding transcriptional regulator [Verrucomicrobiota bacterium]